MEIDVLLISLYALTSTVLVAVFPLRFRYLAVSGTGLFFVYQLLQTSGFLLLLGLSVLYYLLALSEKLNGKNSLFLILLLAPMVLNKVMNNAFPFDDLIHLSHGVKYGANWSGILNVLGLSYFTFNGLSYLFDVRRKFVPAEKNLLRLIAYLLYFPSFASGPLNRYKPFRKALDHIEIRPENLTNGLRMIAWGGFKNFVIAFRLERVLESMVGHFTGMAYLLVGFVFFLYLYTSFSSYVNIARGISALVGIPLKDNFNHRVYASWNRQMFWKGWHITLNEWFRDYFFYDAVKFDKNRRVYFWLFVTFLLTALWHDVSLVFCVWGMLNATWIILEKKLAIPDKLSKYKWGKIAGTGYHLFFASILAVIFITPTNSGLLDIIQSIPESSIYMGSIPLKSLSLSIIGFGVMDFIERKAGKQHIGNYLSNWPVIARWVLYLGIMVAILIFGSMNSINNYYNQF